MKIGSGEEELQNLLIEYTNTLGYISNIIDILQYNNKVNSFIFLLAVNLAILYFNWVELLAAMAFLFFGLFESTQKPTKTDKDINQSIIHLQKINIGLNQFKFGCYTFTQSSIAVAVAAFLRLILPTRFFYSLSFTCLFLVNNPEIYVILDSFNSQYSLKDKRIPFITLVKDKLNTLKRNKSKSKDTMFRFEIYENQRWWMGLDWTHALLPGERPTWLVGFVLSLTPALTFTSGQTAI